MGLLKDGWETAARTGDFRGRATRTDLFNYWLLTFLVGGALLIAATLIELMFGIFAVFLFLPGEEGANRYGPNPRYQPSGEPA